MQEEAPLWFCSRCMAEQYRWDLSFLRHGCRICANCLSRLENEEETNLS